jgi:hypothetical protein
MLIRIRRPLPRICGSKTIGSKGVMSANPLLLFFSPGKIQAFQFAQFSNNVMVSEESLTRSPSYLKFLFNCFLFSRLAEFKDTVQYKPASTPPPTIQCICINRDLLYSTYCQPWLTCFHTSSHNPMHMHGQGIFYCTT